MSINDTEISFTDTSFVSWNPSSLLRYVSSNDLRFSVGFLRSDLAHWFQSFSEEWEALFHSLDIEVGLVKVKTGFDFPQHLTRVTPIEINGEIAVIGMDEEAERAISDVISLGVSDVSADLLVEYFERRFVSTLSKGWTGPQKLECSFISPEDAETAEIVGVVELAIDIASRPISIWLGIGPSVTETLDLLWRQKLGQADSGIEISDPSQSRYDISIELSHLAVAPAELIDYLRAGTVISLKKPMDSKVRLLMNDRPFAEGQLCQFEDRFAVEISSTSPSDEVLPEATTRVQVILAKTSMDQQAFIECHQPGACFLTDVEVNASVQLRISGEDVATAELGVIDGAFALNVLPK